MAKKMILCRQCNLEWEKTAKKYINSEVYRYLRGKAKADYKCDSCDKDLPKMTVVYAATNYPLFHHNNPELGWEGDYIYIDAKQGDEEDGKDGKGTGVNHGVRT
jgi:hypothetical protein